MWYAPVWTASLHDVFGLDLVDMTAQYTDENDGYRYVLVVLDCFSRYIWCEPLKTKTPEEVWKAFEKVVKKNKPNKIWVDNGKEFYNSY